MTNCLFCKIAQREIPANIIYEDEHSIAFDDISPQAPIHKIITPRQHIATLNDLTPQDALLIGQWLLAATSLAKQLNIAEQGYRLVSNCNTNGGQTIGHVHIHLLGDRQLTWPPG